MTSKIIIETNRLHLRPIQLSDAKGIFEYRSMPEVYEYQNWKPLTIKDVQDFINEKIEKIPNKYDTWYQLAISIKETNQLVGDIGLHFLDPESKQVEIGYTLSTKQQGKGYATEAVVATIDYLFRILKKHRVTASVDPKNLKSIKLLDRIGMRKEGYFRQSIWFNHSWADDILYAVLEDEWLNR